jgi:deoxyribonuclease V
MAMLLAVDVDYRDDMAVAAGILFEDWEDSEPVREKALRIQEVADYVPGKFYQRELPCIWTITQHFEGKFDLVVIDGFVHLGPNKKPGLGWYLWDKMGRAIPVIGVAKSAFKGTPPEAALCRGSSQKPLYVTSVGISLFEAKARVGSMAGPYRIPTLLKRVDKLCRR